MSWGCPHQSGEEPYCDRRNQPCNPRSKGCVLYGKVQFIGQEKEDSMKTPEALEADLHEHIHLENNILVPASPSQEQRMNADTI